MIESQLAHSEVRRAVFQAMSRERPPNQFVSLSHEVNSILSKSGFAKADGVQNAESARLSGRAETLLREVVWELIAQGVLVVGFNDSNTDWPFLSLTFYGRSQLASEKLSPYDPDGFMAAVQTSYPSIPAEGLLYLQEAVSSFNRRLFLAAVVMLGVSAEALMHELARSVASSFEVQAKGISWLEKHIVGRPALRQHKSIFDRLQSVASEMSSDLAERLDTHFRGIYGLIRQHRNEAGHPTGVQRTRDEVLPLFYLYATQAKLVSDLSQWLNQARRF